MTLDELFNSALTISVNKARSGKGLSEKLYRKELDAKLRATLFLLYSICSDEICEGHGANFVVWGRSH